MCRSLRQKRLIPSRETIKVHGVSDRHTIAHTPNRRGGITRIKGGQNNVGPFDIQFLFCRYRPLIANGLMGHQYGNQVGGQCILRSVCRLLCGAESGQFQCGIRCAALCKVGLGRTRIGNKPLVPRIANRACLGLQIDVTRRLDRDQPHPGGRGDEVQIKGGFLHRYCGVGTQRAPRESSRAEYSTINKGNHITLATV